METESLVKAAQKAIGENTPNDYILNPTHHGEVFENSAPSLATIFNTSEVKTIAQQYEKWDRIAIDAQREYKRKSNLTSWSTLGAAICSAGLLVISILGIENSTNTKLFMSIFALSGMFFGVVAAILLNVIRSGGLLEKWMQNRANAEMQRLQYFNLVTSNQTNVNSKIPIRLLQLEYFRRFQLDVQKNYYSFSSLKHDSAAAKALTKSVMAMGAVALTNGAAGYLGSTVGIKWTALAALCIIAISFITKITSTESLNQDARNAKRYLRTASTLFRLSGQLDDVRKQILAGNKEILNEFVEAVHEQLSLDHRQWMESISKAGTAIGKFEKHLEDLKEQKVS